MAGPESRPMVVTDDTRLLDLIQGGQPGRFSGYLLTAPRPAIIEPGSKLDVPRWLEALEHLGIPRDEIAYVVVTHIHLDHGGGAAALLRELPSARVVVHPAGARHLVNPERLIQGARAIFGERLERCFGLPDPAAPERIEVVEDGETLDLGAGHRLRFLEARGHARHQHMILDEGTGMLFSADELGVRYLPASGDDRDYVLPSTVPNQFDPDAMLVSARRVRSLGPTGVLFSHFGPLRGPVAELVERIEAQVPAFVRLIGPATAPLPWQTLRDRLERHIRADLEAQEIEWTPELAASLEMDIEVCARGLADYHARRLGAAR